MMYKLDYKQTYHESLPFIIYSSSKQPNTQQMLGLTLHPQLRAHVSMQQDIKPPHLEMKGPV